MSSSLNQQFNQLSQMDQFKGMNQFMSNPQGPDDFVSLFYFYNFNFISYRIQISKC